MESYPRADRTRLIFVHRRGLEMGLSAPIARVRGPSRARRVGAVNSAVKASTTSHKKLNRTAPRSS
jgi:hypothetical protein